jgi:uncharacterized protein (DUF1697 family)
MRAVALIRGMNIGTVRVPMRELAAALERRGASDVRTVLASGNVVLTAPEADPAAIGGRVAEAIREEFGFDLAVIAASVEVVREAVDEYPFPRADDRHAYVVFAESRAALAELVEGAGALDASVEQVRRGEDVLYWDAPKGETLTTAFGRHFGKRQRSGAVTTRNIRTLEKVLAAV